MNSPRMVISPPWVWSPVVKRRAAESNAVTNSSAIAFHKLDGLPLNAVDSSVVQ